jgi:hypothetical protein
MKQINPYSRGQVMVIAVIIMVILMLGILFLFDLQSVIRSKVKIETANQAAALAAAQWQKESLNLIGELNLIKACDQLQGYVPDGSRNKLPQEQAADACKIITQMQTRMAFVGPVIAFGAAQQAAKNNGVNIYDYQQQPSANTLKQVQLDALNYYNNLDINTPTGEMRYGDAYRNGINGRYPGWWDDYRGMLKGVIDQGIAVRPNVRIGIERVTPYAFKDRVFYNAILGEWWCYYPLRSLLKQPDSYWSGKWWQKIQYDNPNFTGQSEIYSLGIKFAQDNAESSVGSYYEQVNNKQPSCWDNYLSKALGNQSQDWIKNTPGVLQQITWCIYDEGYWDSARMDYIGSYWNRSQGGYLSGDIKSSVSYDGAVAYAECSQTINLINSFESKMDEATDAEAKASLKGVAPSPVRTRSDTIINKGVPVGNDASQDGYPAGVIARTVGHLGGDVALKPADVQIILPAFDNVVLFPIAMYADNVNTLRNTDDPLSAFIIWLKTADDIYTPTVAPPAGSELYLQAIQKLDTESFRRTGYNNKYVTGTGGSSAYFAEAYKYSVTNLNGAGWLQQIYIFTDSNPDYAKDLINQTKRDTINPAFSRYYFPYSNQYILIDTSGKARTNEQERCGGGYAPDGYHGPKSGPARI